MASAQEDEVITGREATPEEVYYITLAEKISQDTLPVLGLALRQMVTLSAALFGAAVAVSDKQLVGRGCFMVVIGLLLASLLAALGGVLPFHADMPRDQPYTIRDLVAAAYRWKRGTLWVSGFMLALAMIVLFVGVVAQ